MLTAFIFFDKALSQMSRVIDHVDIAFKDTNAQETIMVRRGLTAAWRLRDRLDIAMELRVSRLADFAEDLS